VILGYGVWKTRYGSDPNILERVVRVDDVACTIIGVMPEDMKFPTNADLWQPFIPNGEQEKRTVRPLGVFGRLRDGVSRSQAQAEMTTIAARLAKQYPDTNKDLGAAVQTFNDRFNGGPIKLVFLSLMGAVGFVLLIACANVANLLLARSAQRAREVAVRVSLGATRARVVRQLLVESIILGLVSGVLGLLLSTVGVGLFDRAVSDVGKPYWIRFTMDARVFSFLALVCVATGIIFGLAPALHISRSSVNELLKEGGRTGSGGLRARRMSGVLIVAEIVLTLVLLSGAGLMMRSFLVLYSLDLGVEVDHLLTMRLVLPERKYPQPDQRLAFQDRLLERLNAMPGVASATVASNVPMGGGSRQTLEVDGKPTPQGEHAADVSVVTVGARYVDTLGLTLPQRRSFAPNDGQKGSEVAVVHARFVALSRRRAGARTPDSDEGERGAGRAVADDHRREPDRAAGGVAGSRSRRRRLCPVSTGLRPRHGGPRAEPRRARRAHLADPRRGPRRRSGPAGVRRQDDAGAARAGPSASSGACSRFSPSSRSSWRPLDSMPLQRTR
jgi:predicted permease